MMRLRPITNMRAVLSYHSKSDGGYLLGSEDLGMRWAGKGSELLGLTGTPTYEQFERLLMGLDPHSGKQLTAKLIEDRLAGWEATLTLPKGVTVANLMGDERVRQAQWEAVHEAVADLEAHIATRVRKGGTHDERLSGNLVALIVPHPETRPAREDGFPDPDDHFHVIIFNVTKDPIENEWKAIKFRPIMDQRKYFDRRFDARLASKLTDLGYGIETKYKADGHGGKRYFSWDIGGLPESVIKKFSRRTGEVEDLAERLGIDDPTRKDKLGATSRQVKRDDMTLDDYRKYWLGRITPAEAQKIQEAIDAARSGRNPRPENTAEKAVRYAIGHEFERRSVVKWTDLAVTALERGMGGAHPDEILPEARRQGVLLKGGEATTRHVLAEEDRVVAFAREGRGTCKPMGNEKGRPGSPERPLSKSLDGVVGLELHNGLVGSGLIGGAQVGGHGATASPLAQPISNLSPEQAAIGRHVWDSPDRVILIRGAAGTGKTHTMKATIAGIDRPVVVLAPSADASRGVLRKEGFEEADTVARFLIDEKYREQARGGVIWVDEAGLLGIRQVRAVFDAAEELGARVVLQGDRRQHGSVERGATLRVLEQFAGLPVAELKDIRRQRGRYKDAVASLAKGDILAGYDTLASLGWVKEARDSKPLVDEYMASLDAGRSVLVVAPTHAEGDGITKEIRSRLKERGIVGEDDRAFKTLVPLHWTDAEKGDLDRFDGTETLQFHRNSGTFKAGDRVRIANFKRGDSYKSPSHFSVYQEGSCALAVGDTIRITANGKTADGKHKLNNGSVYTVAGFTEQGDILLGNGWTVAADYGHLAWGYVTTSHASQGKTVDRVLIAMGQQSRPAISAEQFYVSVSRGRERATIYSDAPREELRAAIQRSDPRKSATELLGRPKPKPRKRDRLRRLTERVRSAFKQLREKAVDVIAVQRDKERSYAR